MEQVKLYRKNALGIGTWSIRADDGYLVYKHATIEGGSEVVHTDKVETNKSGRTLAEQIELEMNSRISRMLDKGYKYLRTEALAGSTNQLGLLNPMLAQPQSSLVPFTSAYCQPKFDGHRCMITNQGGDIIAYTRKGKPIPTIGHILQDFHWLPEGKTVDGELYLHGEKLQTISSLIKREQAGTKLLRYHWYDYVSLQVFSARLQSMEKAQHRFPMKHSEVVPSFKISSIEQAYKLYHYFKDELKYEGAMIRLDTVGYEDNKRASQLIKVKVAQGCKRDECEVQVIGMRASKDGWAILVVKTIAQEFPTSASPKPGVTFDISAPGSIPEKRKVLENLESYIGRKLTVEYAMLTDDGIPFHAVAMRWHEEL